MREFLATRARKMRLARGDSGVERSARTTGERNQAFRFPLEPSEPEVRLLVRRGLEKRTGVEPHQAAIAMLARGQKDDARTLEARYRGAARPRFLVGKIKRQRAADDGLNAHAGHLLREFQRSEHVVGVGERERRLLVGLRQLGEPSNGQRAFKQRVRRVDVQVDEARHLRPRDSQEGTNVRGAALAANPKGWFSPALTGWR